VKVAIDLGTTISVVYVVGRGVVLREPSAVAVHREDGRVIAYGERARGMLGRVPASIEVIRPLRDGVIAHFEAAREILRHFIEVATEKRWIKRSRIVICVPHGATPVEMDALRRESLAAGAHHVDLVKEPFAAALGAGLPLEEPRGNLIVDIGGGTTEATAIALNNIVHCESLRMAGNAMDQVIEEHFRSEHHFLIGETTAERIKIDHGSVIPVSYDDEIELKGLNMRTGCPAVLRVPAIELHDALEPIFLQIIEAIRRTIEHLPPELAGDVLTDGAAMVGGGALLRGWVERLSDTLGLPIRIAEDPLMAVTRGLIRILEDPQRFADLVLNSEYPAALAV
jgi:rod shape-determining protein MreB and related proteins